jgi:hypothetical protein
VSEKAGRSDADPAPVTASAGLSLAGATGRLTTLAAGRKPEEALMASGNSTSKRGFASMNIERQREIASKGGRSVPADKR